MHYPLQPSLLLLIQTLGGSADSINRVGSPDLRRPRASIDSVGADLRDLIQSRSFLAKQRENKLMSKPTTFQLLRGGFVINSNPSTPPNKHYHQQSSEREKERENGEKNRRDLSKVGETRRKDQHDVAILLEKLANDEKKEVDPSVKNAAANQSQEGDTAAGNDVKDAVVSPISGDCTGAENQSKVTPPLLRRICFNFTVTRGGRSECEERGGESVAGGSQNAVAILLEKLANDEEEEVDPSVKNPAANQSKEGDTAAGNDVKDAVEGDHNAVAILLEKLANDEEEEVEPSVKNAAANQPKEGDQNAVAIFLEKLANDEEEEVDPSVKNEAANQSKEEDTVAGNDVKDDVVSLIFEDGTAAENQSKEGDTAAGNDVKDGVVSPISGDGTAAESNSKEGDQNVVAILLEKLANDEEEEVDPSVKNAAANQSKEGDTAAGNDVKDALVSPISGDGTAAENQSKAILLFEAEKETPRDTAAANDGDIKDAAVSPVEGDTVAGNDVKDDVVSLISEDGTAAENQSKEGYQNDMAILLEKLANDEEEEVDPSVKNVVANQSKAILLFEAEKETPRDTAAANDGDIKDAAVSPVEGDTAAGNDIKDVVVSPISGDCTTAENQSKEGDQNAVAILLEKLANDEEEEVYPSVKNQSKTRAGNDVKYVVVSPITGDGSAAENQLKTRAGNDVKDVVVSPITGDGSAAENQLKGDTTAGNDVKDAVVSPISGDGTAAENQSKEGDQNAVAILLEKMANDEEEEVDPSVKNAAANQSMEGDTAAGNDVKDAVVSPLSGDGTAAENQSKEGDTAAGMMSRMPWCHRYLEMAWLRRIRSKAIVLFEAEKETLGDTAAANDGDVKDAVVSQVVRPRIRQIKRPWNVVTDTTDKVISTASLPNLLEKETPGDTAAARILKPTQRLDGTLWKAIKIRDRWVPEDEVVIYRHPHSEVKSPSSRKRTRGEDLEKPQQQEGDQNAVAILLEKLAKDEEEEVDPSVKNAAANQSKGDTAAGNDVKDDVVSLISGDGTAAENQSKEGDQNDVAILLEKLANDEEVEVYPSVKNAAANQSKEGDTVAGNDVKDAVVSPLSGDGTAAENQSKEGYTAAGNDVKDAVVSPLSGDGTAVENQAIVLFEAEKETHGDTAAANDGDVKDAVVSPVVRPRIRRIKQPWNVVTDTADKVISTASSPNLLEKETPGDTTPARILKPTQRPDGEIPRESKAYTWRGSGETSAAGGGDSYSWIYTTGSTVKDNPDLSLSRVDRYGTAAKNQLKEGDQNAVAILLKKLANDEEEEVDPSVKNAAANQSKTRRWGMMARMPWFHRYLEMARRQRLGNDVKDAVVSPISGDDMAAENQSKEGDQNAVAILLEKMANNEEEEVDPSVKNAAANQPKEGDTAAGNDVKDSVVSPISGDGTAAENQSKEGDTAAGNDVKDSVVSPISGDGTAAENQSKEGDQNAVAILIEKMANDEEEEVDPSVKNAAANQSKGGDTAAGNYVKDAVVSPLSGDDTAAENQSKEGDTAAGNDVKDAMVSPLSGDGTAAENQVEAEKETLGDTAAANDGDVKDAVVSQVVRPRIRQIKRPWNVVTDTADKVISTASSPNLLEKETPGDTAAARIIKPTQRPDGTLRKAMKIRDGWVPEDEVVIYRHPHSEVKSPANRKRTRGEDLEKPQQQVGETHTHGFTPPAPLSKIIPTSPSPELTDDIILITNVVDSSQPSNGFLFRHHVTSAQIGVCYMTMRLRSVEKSSYVSKWCEEGSSNLSLILKSTGSGSFGSVLSSDGNDRGFEIKYAGDRFSLMNLKIARKRCSQATCESFNFVYFVCDLSTCSVDSKEESSYLSTGSSEVSTTASISKLRNQKSYKRVKVEVKKKESSRSSSIRRRAKDILEFLSSASASEVQIRQILGNTPDTSKALRMYSHHTSLHQTIDILVTFYPWIRFH
uniref:WIBG Mago-binding domain-containing protein n=1 Tax=Brassica oleracea var. oleracea TaxID=109376 RepID=A0A0D3DTY1_BRAOL